MAPKLVEIYKVKGQWHDVVATAMNISNEMQVAVVRMWERNAFLAKENGETLHPQHFAEMFVDKNFR